jgi:hypothetical protein
LQLVDLRPGPGDVTRPDLAGKKAGAAFEKPKSEHVVIEKPELRLEWQADDQRLEKAPTLFGVTKRTAG